MKKDKVILNRDEVDELTSITKRGKRNARVLKNALILLNVGEGAYGKANSAFVAAMEQVLDVYRRPCDPAYPVVCMDEAPRQLIAETRIPLAGKPGRPQRYDYEYMRGGFTISSWLVKPCRASVLCASTSTEPTGSGGVYPRAA